MKRSHAMPSGIWDELNGMDSSSLRTTERRQGGRPKIMELIYDLQTNYTWYTYLPQITGQIKTRSFEFKEQEDGATKTIRLVFLVSCGVMCELFRLRMMLHKLRNLHTIKIFGIVRVQSGCSMRFGANPSGSLAIAARGIVELTFKFANENSNHPVSTKKRKSLVEVEEKAEAEEAKRSQRGCVGEKILRRIYAEHNVKEH